MPEEFDGWKLETGLPTAFKGTVQDNYYETDVEYNDGKDLLLKLEVMTDDPEIGEGGKTTLLYTTGQGWEAYEKGAKARREDGKVKKGFNESSGVGLLVKAALTVGAGDVLKTRVDPNIGPRDASIWKGLTFDWERKEFTGKINGEDRTWHRMLPVLFHGENGVSAPVKAAPAPAVATPEAPNAPEAAPAASNGGGELSASLKAKMTARARTAADHDQFIEKCYSELDITGDQVAEDAVMDPSFYASLKG